ncbi:MAG TPA: hypothetical protein PL001_11675, partial [Candidatus Kryptobacter bacterium]|nr:hypothetical protein [Candidatus Kryptobacter bacterium]
MKTRCFVNGLMFCLFFLSVAAYSQDKRSIINLCCNPNSDLYVLLRKENVDVKIYKTPRQAISSAMKGTGVLILADSYPMQRTSV